MNFAIGTTGRPAEILHVDDQEEYVELTREGFKMAKVAANLHYAKDGEQCLAFIRKQGQYADVPTPDIILLDLNMPRMGGQTVLAEISRDETLRDLPIIVLTSSQDEGEIFRMYQLRCSSYIVKPIDFNELVRFIKSFSDYWLTVAVLPSKK
jgi:two-component system response regulator